MILDEDYVIQRANLALADELGTAIQRVVGRRCHEVRGAVAAGARRQRRRALRRAARSPRRSTRAPPDGEVRSTHGRTYIAARLPAAATRRCRSRCASYHDVTDERVMTRQLGERRAARGDRAPGRRRRARDQQPAGRHPRLRADPAARGRHGRGAARLPGRDRAERAALQGDRRVAAALLAAGVADRAARAVAQRRRARRRARLRGARGRARAADVRLRAGASRRSAARAGRRQPAAAGRAHLLGNALDSGGRRGEIEIVDLRARRTTSCCASPIRGRASPRSTWPSLFDPFFTTKEEGKGRGPGPGGHLRDRPGARRQDHRAQPRERRRRVRGDAARAAPRTTAGTC